MAKVFLYIDDNQAENAKGIITGLEEEGELSIEFTNPTGDWEKERERILSEKFKQYNGLILDLNLEETPNQEDKTSHYKGSSLAQEIRDLSKAGRIKAIPIILLSANVNLEKYFDRTSEDLFDLIVSRERLNDHAIFISLREKLISLSQGYSVIAECKEKGSELGVLFQHDMSKEDIRFISEIQSVFEGPTHSISNFLIKNLLEKSNIPISGVLISEDVLAARLGIDILNSPDWIHILEQLKPYKYYGVFSEGWSKWWASGLEYWWSVHLEIQKSLRSTNASQKVALLIEKLKLPSLVELKKSEKSHSETFWTTCIGSGIAIDTTDGLLVSGQDNSYPWQDRNYISIEEALNPKRKKAKWKNLAPFENQKLEILRKQFPNTRTAR